jgi:hypothetical protein
MLKVSRKNLFWNSTGTNTAAVLRATLLVWLAAFLAWAIPVYGQIGPEPAQEPSGAQPLSQEETQKNPDAPCVQPPPSVRWQDYKGPFDKVVGTFGRKLERKSTHVPHYKPGLILCSLDAEHKFILFVEDTIDPVTFLGAGFNAGIDQAENTDPDFRQGAAGYGKRFGAELTDSASSDFFKDFAYPTIFSEDPRYYRLGHGKFQSRLSHALEHAVIAHRENGARMFNFSEWLGTTSAVALGDLYHPNNKPGIAPAAKSVGYGVLTDAGFDVLREFWPEIAHKLKLPFREERESANSDEPSASFEIARLSK